MYKHILFATDLTEDTQYLIEKVLTICAYTKAKLSIIHVVEPLPGYSYAYLGIEDIEGQLVTESKQSMSKLVARLNIPISNQFIEIGPTKTKILKNAEDINADLIICGSHGRHGLSLLLGSTANAILHGAKCDVLTVRLPEES
jgi:universal stress protein A